MTGRIERLREQARIHNRQQQERIASGKVKVPTAADANAALGRQSFKTAAQAANQALAASAESGRERLITEHDRRGDMEAMPSGIEQLDALIARLDAGEPGLDDKLTPHQRMTIGRRKAELQLQQEIAEADAEQAASAGT